MPFETLESQAAATGRVADRTARNPALGIAAGALDPGCSRPARGTAWWRS